MKENIVLYGTTEIIPFNYTTKSGNVYNQKDFYEGIINNLQRRYMETSSTWIREWLERYMIETTCTKCNGSRLRDEVLSVLINGKNIYEVTILPINDMLDFINNL